MAVILIFYFFIFISCLLFYVLYVDTLSFYLLLTVIIIPVIMLITLIISKRKVKLQLISTGAGCYCGDTVPVILRITNSSMLTVSCIRLKITYQNQLGSETERMTINTPVFSNNQQEICLRISTECCGMVEVSVNKAKIYDMLRIFSFRVKCENSKASFMVCPRIVPLEPQIALYQNGETSDDTFSKRSPGDDPSEIFQLHEYQPGDKINRIHWKASVKQDEFMVKDFSRPIQNCVAFMLLCCNDEEDPIEAHNKIMTAAASLSVAMTESEAPHTFIWRSGGQNMSVPASDLESYLRFLAIKLSSPISGEARLAALESYIDDCISGRAARYAHIVIFTTVCDNELLSLLSTIDMQIKITVICCSEAPSDFAEEHLAYGSETEILYIGSNEAIAALNDMII